MDPDELYTLRSQYWLGQYSLCIDEGKSIARRPMSADLKAEREEFVLRAQLALGQYDRVINEAESPNSSVAIRALGLHAKYLATANDVDARQSVIETIQGFLNDPDASNSSSLQLTACNIFLTHGEMMKEALQCVHLGMTMEHLAVCLQIYIKIDRLDLAENNLMLMKQADEDSTLAQLCKAYLSIAHGSSRADDAIYALSHLSEQYGPSPMLLNCMAVANIVAKRYDAAEINLNDALQEEPGNADALVNLLVCSHHTGKKAQIGNILQKLQVNHPDHPFVLGLGRVEGAFDREAVKYSVSA